MRREIPAIAAVAIILAGILLWAMTGHHFHQMGFGLTGIARKTQRRPLPCVSKSKPRAMFDVGYFPPRDRLGWITLV
jgi:hypothetical protein